MPAQPPPAPFLHFDNQTLRQIVHPTAGGSQIIRLVLSNVFGTAPLTIGAASVALRDSGPAIVAASSKVVTFSGQPTIAIPAGAMLLSDPVALTFPAAADIAGRSVPARQHQRALAGHDARRGAADELHHGHRATTPASRRCPWWRRRRAGSGWRASKCSCWRAAGVLVAFGDFITDGAQSGLDANRRWPDLLAARLASAGTRLSVVNGAIGGDRVLEDGIRSHNALARFDRDVLAQPGVRYVTVLEGINDIGVSGAKASPSVADLIAGHRQLIDRAHAHGLRVYGATLTPFEGAAYFTPEGEAKRQALNDWIRKSGAYDGVIDFDAAARDPAKPSRSAPTSTPATICTRAPPATRPWGEAIDVSLFKAATAVARGPSR